MKCLDLLVMTSAATAFSISALADPAPPPTLHLSSTATISIHPDLLAADFTALASSPTAVSAQRQVNSLIAKAVAAASKPGITVTTQDYSVSFDDEKPPRWTAQQSLGLQGTDGAAILSAVANLQSIGLAIGDLGWQPSPKLLAQARRDATNAALKQLRQDAATDAAALGLTADHFQSVEINGASEPVPLMRNRTMGFAMAAAMPPPTATQGNQDVSVTVSADVALRGSAAP